VVVVGGVVGVVGGGGGGGGGWEKCKQHTLNFNDNYNLQFLELTRF
jgi:hypothetical protein